MNHGFAVKDLAEGQRLITWEAFGKAFAMFAHEWAEYITDYDYRGLTGDPNMIDWYVEKLNCEALDKTAGNVGVFLVDWDEGGIVVEHDY